MKRVLVLVLCIAVAVIGGYFAFEMREGSGPESRIASLKEKSAALVASAKAAFDPKRTDAAPEIFRVEGTGSVFTDCPECPQMVVVPAGAFTMGSPSDEMYRGDETQHRVLIEKPFAVGKFEVTFEEWDACVAEGGCGKYRPDDFGWGRSNHPVVSISWRDARAYVDWLAKKTGKPYRLLSESEWEYAARAGTTTPYSFGDTATADKANINGSESADAAPSATYRAKTTPAGSFAPNAFGLYDMHGNAWEWVEDCWNDEYTPTAPADGSAWLAGGCGGRIMRGGSWEDPPPDVRAAARVGGAVDDQYWTDGFRVARDL